MVAGALGFVRHGFLVWVRSSEEGWNDDPWRASALQNRQPATAGGHGRITHVRGFVLPTHRLDLRLLSSRTSPELRPEQKPDALGMQAGSCSDST